MEMDCMLCKCRWLGIFLAVALVFIGNASVALAAWAYGSGEEVEPASFYFSDFEENLQDLSLLGDAKFVRIEGQVDGMAVQLSGTRQNTVGRLLYSIPVNMLDASGTPASFSTYFCFSMTSFAGDGLAFIVAPDKTTIGASGPWLGLVEQDEIVNQTAQAPNTFAVEFDSVMNEELRDPNSNHVGLDLETIVSAVTANASDIAVVLNDGSRTYAWVDFDGKTTVLEVRISKTADEKPTSPLLSHKIDLAKIWKPWMYVGFSSSTGQASQKHKVFSWRFWSGTKKNAAVQVLRSHAMHSFPVDPAAIAPEGKVPSGNKPGFDAGVLISLLVGFTCGASVTLFLLVGWALIKSRKSEAARLGYQDIGGASSVS